MASWDFSLGSLAGGASREKAAMDSVVGGLEVSAGAFATAYATSKWADYQSVMGVSTSLLGGLALSAVGLLDSEGQWGQHVSRLGHGALAVYFAGLGATQGSAKTGAVTGALPAATPAFSVDANNAYAAARKY